MVYNLKIIPGGVTAPQGFMAAGIHAGVRKNKEKKDMALLFSEVPAAAGGMFTRNVVKAAPVIWNRGLIEHENYISALVVNSGAANACTGEQGYQNVVREASYVADMLGIEKDSVAIASTGVIGIQLPMERIYRGIDELSQRLSPDESSGTDAAQAIMTTDLYLKEYALSFEIKGRTVRLGGMCKGSGMINPNLGTVLAFITTDLNIRQELLQKTIREDVCDTINMVSVDGEISTNDMVMIFANGKAGNEELMEQDADYEIFKAALREMNTYFARQIAADGEGASRSFEVEVEGACDKIAARHLAKSVVTSNLTKCAIYGADANWGRFLCAMGGSGIEFDPYMVDIYIESSEGSLQIVHAGQAAAYDEAYATQILTPPQVAIRIDMNMGEESAKAWGCDLTYDFIKINADYRKH